MNGDNFDGMRRLLRPVSMRSWRRRAAVAAVIGIWLIYLIVTGSLPGSLLLLLALAVFAGIVLIALRSLGIGADHPLIRPLATRPWRDGRDILQLALKHLREVFIITPNGSLLAPSAVELCMNPADVDSLSNVIDLDLVEAYAAEAYQKEILDSSARVLRNVPIELSVVEDPDVPPGRYRIRQRRPQSQGHPSSGLTVLGGAESPPMGVEAERDTMPAGDEVAYEPPGIPLLRLVTNNLIAETRTSPARAGRSRLAELTLPNEMTISRIHARFNCIGGHWCMTSLGSNGATVNGVLVDREHLIRHGDVIRWGQTPDAVRSVVEILSSRGVSLPGRIP